MEMDSEALLALFALVYINVCHVICVCVCVCVCVLICVRSVLDLFQQEVAQTETD